MTAQKPLEAYPDIECACKRCVSMCTHHPCIPTPEEAKLLMRAGKGELLVCNWFYDERREGDIRYLQPALVGYQGCQAPFWVHGRCVFLSPEGLCQLHGTPMKPAEGRKVAHHGHPLSRKDVGRRIHEKVIRLWDSPRGRAVVQWWKTHYEKSREAQERAEG